MLNHTKSDAGEEKKWALPRRDFLVLGSTAVVCAATSSVSASAIRAIVSPASGAILSVGYAEPLTSEADAPMSRLVAGRSLRLADSRFRRDGVRVSMHGLSLPEAHAGEPLSVRMSTFAPGAAPVPFLAWSYDLKANGLSLISARSSFTAVLHLDGTLSIAIERHTPVSVSSRRLGSLLSLTRGASSRAALPNVTVLEQEGSVCRLSSGDRGDVRLRSGLYFVALRRSAGEGQPDWSSIVVDRNASNLSEGVLRRAGRAVDFEYIAFTVDYATV